jgi:hypothetical protein
MQFWFIKSYLNELNNHDMLGLHMVDSYLPVVIVHVAYWRIVCKIFI